MPMPIRSRVLRGVLCVAVAAAVAGPMAADPALDLHGSLYRALDQWHVRGLLSPLPLLRPYPRQLLRQALAEVLDRGAPADRVRVAEFLAELGEPVDGRVVSAAPGMEAELRAGGGEYFSRTVPSLAVLLDPHPLVTGTAEYRLAFLDQVDGPALARGYRERTDWIRDNSDIELFGRRIDIQQYLRSDLAVGTADVYGQAGLGRASVGPFHDDGSIVSDQAPGAARFALVWRTDTATIETLLLPLTATNDFGGRSYPEKYLFLHAFRFHPAPGVELGLVESVVYGGRFEPVYLVPLASAFLNQGLLGFGDNSLLGVYAVATLLDQLRIPVVIYADDVHFNDLARLDFNTKYKLAAHAGVEWYPLFPVLERVLLDYLAVMPYMYTHWDETVGRRVDKPNYSNYTHLGTSIGPSLEPNSDRLTLDLRLAPAERLGVALRLRHSRHGNASDGYLPAVDGGGLPDGDGTIFDPGYIGSTPTFQAETRFLWQDVLERVTQAGLDVEYRLPLPAGGAATLSAGYLFEHARNVDLVEGANLSRHLITLGATYRW